ncbi:hypothetical protein [Lysobacter tyrosinilyticus]
MATVLLLAALTLPVVLFWLLKSRSRLSGLIAAAFAIAAGWALNLVWAFAAHESLAIAGAFGWICPSILVGLTWLVWRFARRRTA